PDARAARPAGRGGPRRNPEPRQPRAPPCRDRLPQGGRGGYVDAPGRGVLARASAAVLVRAHLGPHPRGRALVPARPDAVGAPSAGTLRAARGLRSARVPRRPPGADLVLEADRALGGREGR